MLYKLTYKKKISKILILCASFCITLSVFFNIYLDNDFRVEFINVGQGDCILISAPHSKNYLIDTGKKSNKDMLQYLKSRGITKLETVFLSHSDDDHSGGLEDVLKNTKVGRVVMPFINFYSAGDIACRDTATSHGTDVEYADRFFSYDLGGGRVDIVWPGDNTIKQNLDNNNSLVMRLDYKGNSFLFTGDMEDDGEEVLMDTDENIDVDVLKVSHHGSKYATTQELLGRVTPSYAVISVGKNNYGHPSLEIIERLEATGCSIYRTDKNGNVVFTINPYGHMSVVTNK